MVSCSFTSLDWVVGVGLECCGSSNNCVLTVQDSMLVSANLGKQKDTKQKHKKDRKHKYFSHYCCHSLSIFGSFWIYSLLNLLCLGFRPLSYLVFASDGLRRPTVLTFSNQLLARTNDDDVTVTCKTVKCVYTMPAARNRDIFTVTNDFSILCVLSLYLGSWPTTLWGQLTMRHF